MHNELMNLAQELKNGTITELQCRKKILTLLTVPASELKKYGFTIKLNGYDTWQLRECGLCLFEGAEVACHLRAFEIMQKTK